MTAARAQIALLSGLISLVAAVRLERQFQAGG
jgi:hypothetical protein